MKKSTKVIVIPTLLVAFFSSRASGFDFTLQDTDISLYGYAKLDAIYDSRSDLGPAANRSQIAIDGQAEKKGHFQAHAFESRLGVKTSTPIKDRNLVTLVEGDFYGSGGGSLRLRQAYGAWNGFLLGQTWTNFGALIGRAPTLDFAAEPGLGNATRQAQIRYTRGGFSSALEDPDFLGGEPASAINTTSGAPITAADANSRVPDLTARYIGNLRSVRFAISGLARELRYDDGTQRDGRFGWGVSAEAAWTVNDKLTARGALTTGDGIGTYMENNPAAPAYYNVITGGLKTVKATGSTVSITYKLGQGSLTLGHGYAQASLKSLEREKFPDIESANDRFSVTHLNYVWSPAKSIEYGAEIAHHRRRVVDGRDGDDIRVQFMGRFLF